MSSWLPEAEPQTAVQVASETVDRSIVDAARARGITGVVHFTRTGGLKGILATRTVKARALLPADARIRFVAEQNAEDRSRDTAWHGYVNLSIGSINTHMFQASKGWHPDDEWVILRFGPMILGDPGVVFCTTNNAYTSVIHRARTLAGFEQMFVDRVPWGHYGSVAGRGRKTDAETTCPQAEVLYPGSLQLDHLQTITVGDDATYDTVNAISSNLPHQASIELSPEAFR